MKPTPILFLSDSPHMPTGLARITKDLAVHTSSLPEFRVGVMGRGGWGSRQLPFAQYNFPQEAQWGEAYIEAVWEDFAGSDEGIIFTIWDISRLHWFSKPLISNTPGGMSNQLRLFLTSGRFKRWGYFPVDATGIHNKMTVIMADALTGFDRVLAYTVFGSQILSNTLSRDIDWIPHGYNAKTFQPRDKVGGRVGLNWKDTDFGIGCVMTNQERKDWGLAFSIIAGLKQTIPNLKFWAHVDVLERAWDLRALIYDFGLKDQVTVTMTGQYSSEQLSYLYSACDLTILPSLGEGFGYPIVESLACGVPVLHGKYGGGAELVPVEDWLIEPAAYRLSTGWNVLRPVFDWKDWAGAVEKFRAAYQYDPPRDTCVRSVEHLKWENLWPSVWRKWMLDGLNGAGD